jgi:hypothetical protein
MSATFFKALMAAMLVFAAVSWGQQNTYFIMGSGTAFTAFVGDDDVVGTANVPVQDAIDAIKADARGEPCAIQFGNGRDENAIQAGVLFDGGADGTDWGEITLLGKLFGTVTLTNGASLDSRAEEVHWIKNDGSGTVTISGGTVGTATFLGSPIAGGRIENNGAGTVIVNDGNVSGIATDRNSTGTIIINGGEVSAIGAYSITSSGTMTINGGSITSNFYISSLETVTVNGGDVYSIIISTLTNTSGKPLGALTITGGSVSTVICDDTNALLILGGSPEIGFISGFGVGKTSVIATGGYAFAPADKIYRFRLPSILVESVAVSGGADYLSNFMLFDVLGGLPMLGIAVPGKPLTNYRLAVNGGDLVVRAVVTGAIYTVSFNLNGGLGSAPEEVSVVSGSRLPRVLSTTGNFAAPAGKVSDGKWYTDAAGATEFVFGANGTAVTANVTLYLKWVENNAILSYDRVIPNGGAGGVAVVAPAAVLSGEFAAGPNPVGRSSGGIVFFWNGKQIKSGTLTVYDASGNVVRKLAVRDNAVTVSAAKRAVGSWDLRDGKGRPVSDGTYLVRGQVAAFGGKGEKVALVVGVR